MEQDKGQPETVDSTSSEKWGTIPEPVRTAFGGINNDLVYLHYRWAIYKQLFRSGRTRIDLLVYVAAEVFFQLHLALLDAVVLGIAKLLDPERGARGEDNMSLELLIAKARGAGTSVLADTLQVRLAAIRLRAVALIKHRNKRISHADAEHHPSISASALPSIEEANIDATLDDIDGPMNAIEQHFAGSQTIYAAFLAPSEGDTLIYALRRSADWDALVEEGLIERDRLTRDRFMDA